MRRRDFTDLSTHVHLYGEAEVFHRELTSGTVVAQIHAGRPGTTTTWLYLSEDVSDQALEGLLKAVLRARAIRDERRRAAR